VSRSPSWAGVTRHSPLGRVLEIALSVTAASSRTNVMHDEERPGELSLCGQPGPGPGVPRVSVLDRRGRPLMPCHPARARELLRKGRAVVARYMPFTIRIKDRLAEDSEVSGIALRIDPGSKATGVAVTEDVTRGSAGTGEVSIHRRGLYAVELLHRGEVIQERTKARATHRRRRRVANTRYRAPRIDNRRRPQGWLPPYLQHRVDTTSSWVERPARLAPLREVHVERVAFDTHALSAGTELEGMQYQRGTLAGYEARQYLLEKWGRCCAYCGKTAVVERIKRQAKSPLRDAAAMNATRKSHTLDALAIGECGSDVRIVRYPCNVLVVTASGRGTYARTRSDAYGFPRLVLTRSRSHYGFQTGDLARADVPRGKRAGTHTGRVAVRASGRFNIRTRQGIVQGIGHQHVHLLQRADGYGYAVRAEEQNDCPPAVAAGFHAGGVR